MEEKWKSIDSFPDYYVSNLGRVYSNKSNKFLSPKSNNGYLSVGLSKDGIVKLKRIHRLVATAFIPNPNNLPCINHKDENPSNNTVDNLEWCTVQYNTLYSSYKWTGSKNPMSRKDVREKHKLACKRAHDAESYFVKDNNSGTIYNSIREAERQTGISRYLIKHSDRFILSEKGGKFND